MDTDWDYGAVATAYDLRPPYVEAALAACFDALAIEQGARVCDVGAGTGRLTSALVRRDFAAVAVEPNAAMRALGVANAPATWIAGRAEALPLRAASVRLVTFGSSFNVVAHVPALAEAARVLTPGGRLLCVWNHRRLDDPLQRRIETIIRARVPSYGHGSRREDQTAVIAASGRFAHVRRLEASCVQRVPAAAWVGAWQSHLTLRRQAGARFDDVVAAIGDLVAREAGDHVEVPYVTRAWLAERGSAR